MKNIPCQEEVERAGGKMKRKTGHWEQLENTA